MSAFWGQSGHVTARDRVLNPPPEPEPEVVYVSEQDWGTPHLGYRDFNPTCSLTFALALNSSCFTSLILCEKICINPICTKPRLRGCMIAGLDRAFPVPMASGDEVCCSCVCTPVRQPQRRASLGALRQGCRFHCPGGFAVNAIRWPPRLKIDAERWQQPLHNCGKAD